MRSWVLYAMMAGSDRASEGEQQQGGGRGSSHTTPDSRDIIHLLRKREKEKAVLRADVGWGLCVVVFFAFRLAKLPAYGTLLPPDIEMMGVAAMVLGAVPLLLATRASGWYESRRDIILPTIYVLHVAIAIVVDQYAGPWSGPLIRFWPLLYFFWHSKAWMVLMYNFAWQVKFWRHALANTFCAVLLLATNLNTCAALSRQAPASVDIAADAQRLMKWVLPWMHYPLTGRGTLSADCQCPLLLGAFQLVATTAALWAVGMLNASAARQAERRERVARGGPLPAFYELGDGGMAVQAALLIPLGQCLIRGIDLYASILSWVRP